MAYKAPEIKVSPVIQEQVEMLARKRQGEEHISQRARMAHLALQAGATSRSRRRPAAA